MGHRTVVAGLAALAVLLGSAGVEHATAAAPRTSSHPTTPVLADPAPCDADPAFTCSTLTVPLDHAGNVGGTLDLAVAAADNVDAPRGVLLLLTGGPGQPGAGLLSRVENYLAPEVREQYRLVVFDQRGTGQDAIDCTALQQATGGSDFLTPPAAAVAACAEQLGSARDFYSTPDTVADIESLRQALDVRRLTIDGVSYGTYTAEHYALAHPRAYGHWCSTRSSRRRTTVPCSSTPHRLRPGSCATRAPTTRSAPPTPPQTSPGWSGTAGSTDSRSTRPS